MSELTPSSSAPRERQLPRVARTLSADAAHSLRTMADAAPSGEGGGGEEGINLQALTLEQLNQLKQQLEEVREAAI